MNAKEINNIFRKNVVFSITIYTFSLNLTTVVLDVGGAALQYFCIVYIGSLNSLNELYTFAVACDLANYVMENSMI